MKILKIFFGLNVRPVLGTKRGREPNLPKSFILPTG